MQLLKHEIPQLTSIFQVTVHAQPAKRCPVLIDITVLIPPVILPQTVVTYHPVKRTLFIDAKYFSRLVVMLRFGLTLI